MSIGPFANGSEPTLIQQISNTTIGKKSPDAIWQNNDSSNRYYEAQKRADAYKKLKERIPMAIEYMESPGKWKSINMYINPDKLSITNQKVKGKAYTRGGIFYHHWGDDSPIMTLSGTTGLAGMKGIEVLEDIYHASGTLLKYKKFGPEKYAQRTGQQSSKLNFDSPVEMMEEALKKASTAQINELKDQVNADSVRKKRWDEYKKAVKKLEDIKKKKVKGDAKTQQNLITSLQNKYGFPSGTYSQLSKAKLPLNAKEINNMKNLSASALSMYTSLKQVNSFLDKVEAAENTVENWASKQKKKPSGSAYKKYALTVFNSKLKGTDSSIITELVRQKTVYYENGLGNLSLYGKYADGIETSSELSEALNPKDGPIPYRDDIVAQLIEIQQDKLNALNSFMSSMSKLEQSQKDFYSKLKNSLDDIMDELKDNWRPRQVVIYFENRAYVGHFDAFSYSRDAANQLLIRYELRLTLTKQVIGTKK